MDRIPTSEPVAASRLELDDPRFHATSLLHLVEPIRFRGGSSARVYPTVAWLSSAGRAGSVSDRSTRRSFAFDSLRRFAIRLICVQTEETIAMSVTKEDLESFHGFACGRLSHGGVESFEALLSEWRERKETNAAIREAIDELNAGLGQPLEEAMEEIRIRGPGQDVLSADDFDLPEESPSDRDG
jgi:hypothetical protein